MGFRPPKMTQNKATKWTHQKYTLATIRKVESQEDTTGTVELRNKPVLLWSQDQETAASELQLSVNSDETSDLTFTVTTRKTKTKTMSVWLPADQNRSSGIAPISFLFSEYFPTVFNWQNLMCFWCSNFLIVWETLILALKL